MVRYEDGEHTIHSSTLLRDEEGAITKNTTVAMGCFIHHKKRAPSFTFPSSRWWGPTVWLVGWRNARYESNPPTVSTNDQRGPTPLIERLDFCGSTSTVIPRQTLQQTRVFFLRSFQPPRQHSSPAEKDENLEG